MNNYKDMLQLIKKEYETTICFARVNITCQTFEQNQECISDMRQHKSRFILGQSASFLVAARPDSHSLSAAKLKRQVIA